LDLPPAKPKRRDIKNDTNEAASTMTKIQMTGDIIMHENAITVDKQDLHIGEEDTLAKLLAIDTHSYDEKHVNDKIARDVDNEHMTTLERPEAYKTACKLDMMYKTNIAVNKVDLFVKKEMLTHDTNLHDGKNKIIQGARSDDMHMNEGAEYVTTSNRHDAYDAAYKMDDDKTHTETNKMADMHEYEEESLTKNEHPRRRNVMTSQTETVDATKILAYMDENYNIPSQEGIKTKPFCSPREREADARVNPYSVTNKNANAWGGASGGHS
jgi:hypothetical protein